MALWASLGGCKSAQERCAEAQAAAQQAWGDYAAQLQRLHDEAMAMQAEAHSKISGPIEQRLSEAAKKQADLRYDRNSSAWLRAYDASLQAACGDDPECFGLKQKSAAAKLRSDDLEPRIAATKAAAEAATDSRAEAQSAAAAVADDFERAELLKAPRQASLAAAEACDGVK